MTLLFLALCLARKSGYREILAQVDLEPSSPVPKSNSTLQPAPNIPSTGQLGSPAQLLKEAGWPVVDWPASAEDPSLGSTFPEESWPSENLFHSADVSEDTQPVESAPEEEKRFMKGLKFNDKRFMRGLKRDADSNFSEDKRFMRGFRNFDDDFSESELVDKRFMKGFLPYDKRFMKGFLAYDKRFMKGFLPYDKRFMKGFLPYDKRFMKGIAPYDKRFMKGFLPYDKRFMKGFIPYDKRFMRGLRSDSDDFSDDSSEEKYFVPRLDDDYPTYDNVDPTNPLTTGPMDKKFMRGLNKRFMRGLSSFDKRFMRGLTKRSASPISYLPTDVSSNELSEHYKMDYDNENTGDKLMYPDSAEKRFMKGFHSYTKKFLPGGTASQESEYTLDKKFMRGLHKKDDAFGGDEEKRFMKGLVKRDDDENVIDEDKRFMKGLVKKNDEEDLELVSHKIPVTEFKFFSKNHTNDESLNEDKRFMRGLGNYAKRDNEVTDEEINGSEDKRFMKGLVKKDNDKRFMKGLVKKDDDKRFMKGLVKKDDDKRFMKGLVKKDDDKRFMKGLVKKDDDIEINDKRFMRGLIKKDFDDEMDDKMDDKRFMRGLVKKEEGGDDFVDDKRFMKGLVKKSENDLEEEKRFMRGLIKKDDDKRFMRGLIKKDDTDYDHDDKRFMKGLIKKDDKEPDDKRFMRGLVKRDVTLHRSRRDINFRNFDTDGILEKLAEEYANSGQIPWNDFFRKVNADEQPMDSIRSKKRFMRGFDEFLSRDYEPGSPDDDEVEEDDNNDDHSEVDKRFMRGFHFYDNDDDTQKRFHSGLNRYAPTRNAYGKRYNIGGQISRYNGNVQKRRVPDFDDYSRHATKRFMRGLRYYRDEDEDDLINDKRFMRGLGNFEKRFMKGLHHFEKRSAPQFQNHSVHYKTGSNSEEPSPPHLTNSESSKLPPHLHQPGNGLEFHKALQDVNPISG
ncbi:uncharacterized protein LOC131933287 [Physella acuta]|uniref:uncharacterized protein LOC131933287 n=1 Tax=Physella acuta TaxID=109671 RepID=UPI0027DAF12E|nr:uncharacterized protein LOC131933287 [Physella acuta]